MPVPDCIIYGVGGTLTYNGATTQPTSARVRILDGGGAEILPSTAATVSTISGVLTASISRDEWSGSVNSNTGMVAGSLFYIQDDPEQFRVRKVAGTTVSFRRPAMKDHVSGAAFEGTTISYSVNASIAGTKFWDGHAEWNIDGSVYDMTAVCCATAPMKAVLPTDDDLRAVLPMLQRGLPAEVDLEQLRELGHDRVMSRLSALAPDQRPQTFYGSSSFRHASALAAAMIYYMPQRGEENRELYERFRVDFEREVDQMVLTSPRDANQNGQIEADERISPTSIRIIS
jgi:hypothetical protein